MLAGYVLENIVVELFCRSNTNFASQFSIHLPLHETYKAVGALVA